MKYLDSAKMRRGGIRHEEAAGRIRLVGLDIDGVLTDGRIGYGNGSDEEIKFFDVKDGVGIAFLRRCGIKVGVVSGRTSAANRRRAAELKLDFVYENVTDKVAAMQGAANQFGFSAQECLFVGDDLIDCALFEFCGLGIAVGDAAPEALGYADAVTEAAGGRGAVREIAVWLLKCKGLMEKTLAHYHLAECGPQHCLPPKV